MASMIVVLISCLLTVFAFLKVKNKWLRLPLLFVILIVGWVVAFTLGYYLGEYYGDKQIALRYVGSGVWWSLLGILIGWFSAKQYNKHKRHNTKQA